VYVYIIALKRQGGWIVLKKWTFGLHNFKNEQSHVFQVIKF
jgi:hypothetical protein